MGRIGLALLGVPLMAIGLVGWILPLVPGLPLFLLGLAMTISWHPKGKALTDRCTQWIKERAIRHGLIRRDKAEIQAELFCPGDPPSDQIHKK
ncbi:MAG: hypothetical protein RI910_1026 [Verrucomicrobiota bacterium]|jgi:uncharacterized membrane protein YbaN (DUF454 family)